MQEKLAKASARAKIHENLELGEKRNYKEKYWEIIKNLYIPHKSRRRILKHHAINKIVIT